MRKFLWSFLVSILIVLAAITLLITTNSGLVITLKAINRFTPVKIKTTGLKGTILGTITAKTIDVKATGIDLQVHRFSLRYNIFAMLWNTIQIDHVRIDSARGALIASTLIEEANENTSSYSPEVVIKHANIGLIDIKAAQNSRPIHAQHIYWQSMINRKRINITLQTGFISHLLKSTHVKIWGPIEDYQITASIVSKYTELGATGSGNKTSASFVFSSEVKDNTVISGDASMDWHHGFQWDSSIQLHNIQTQPFLENGPLIYFLNATCTGLADGKLNQIDWQFDAKTTAGDVASQGQFNEKELSFNWKMNQINPHSFYPNVNGRLNSTGTWNNGKTNGLLTIKDGQWQDITLHSFKLNWRGDVERKIINLLNLKINQLRNDVISINEGSIDFKKTVKKITPFSVDLTIDSENVPLRSLSILGNIKQLNNGYTLHLNQFNLNALLRKWSLKNSADFSLLSEKKDNHNITALKQTPFCLISNKAYLCENSAIQDNNWAVNLDAQHIPIQNLAEISNVTLATNIKANIYRKDDAPIEGELQIHIPNGTVTFSEYEVEHLVKLEDTKLILKLLPKMISLSSTSHWGKKDYWQLYGEITRPTNERTGWDEENLKGNLRLSINDLGFINTFSDIFDLHNGSINGDMQVSGTIHSPQVNGMIGIKNIGLEVVPVANTFSNIHGDIFLHNSSANMNLTGNSKSGPINLAADISMNPGYDNLKATFSLKGSEVQIADSSNYQAVADIDMIGKFEKNIFSINGGITIPKATINPASFNSSGINLPKDIEIAGEQKEKTMKSNIDILIQLGKEVAVKTKKIYARLTGGLHILQKDDSEPLGKGTIFIKDGKVSDFDLDLQISDDSSISYDNTPLTSPFINVKIFRVLKQGGFSRSTLSSNTDLTVGISAIGIYQNLVVTLYSEPIQLGQSDILSYLILGHPVGNAGAFNLASLLATVGSLSSDTLSSGLNKLLSIKNTLGFTELGVQSNLSLDALGTPYGVDESGFVIGRYLTSKIYVRYISGISSDLNIFQLQYFFNPNWSVQVQSGNVDSTNVQGVDGLYHFTHW